MIQKESLEESLELYAHTYQEAMAKALAEKLGLASLDEDLTKSLFSLLGRTETDFTLFFRGLANVSEDEPVEPLRRAFYAEPDVEAVKAWVRLYLSRVRSEGLEARVQRMNAVNPKYVFRNYLAQLAIDALEKGDASVLERLMQALSRPYDEQPQFDDLAERRPEWARHRAGCSALSCSS